MANTHLDVAHLVVRDDSDITSFDDLRVENSGDEKQPAKKIISVGAPQSGDRAISQFLIEELKLNVSERELHYDDAVGALLAVRPREEDRIDAAIFMAGEMAKVFRGHLSTAIAECEVSTDSDPSLRGTREKERLDLEHTIPRGLYRPWPILFRTLIFPRSPCVHSY